jgi:nucleotide-binding universal stress UspA family protein
MYQKILVPIDSSPCSRAAVQLAARLSRAWGSQLCLAHVLSDSQPDHAHQARTLLERHLGVARFAPNLLLEPLQDSLAQTISKLAEREAAELIVIGTYAHSKLERQATGSLAHELAVLSQTPVLIVPAVFRKHGFEARWAHVPAGGVLCS